jgi:hypothetical protein
MEWLAGFSWQKYRQEHLSVLGGQSGDTVNTSGSNVALMIS